MPKTIPVPNWLQAFVFLVALLLAPTVAQAQLGPPLKRGIGVHAPLNWPDLNEKKDFYAWPPFGDPEQELPQARLLNVAKAGFDFVRLTVDPGPFIAYEGERRDQLEDQLVATVKRIRSVGLDVLVDLHPVNRLDKYKPATFVVDPAGGNVPDYLDLLERISERLATVDKGHVALEIMNEPQIGWDTLTAQRWQKLAELMHAAVRKAAPDLLVVVTGGQGGSFRGLIALDPRPFLGSNVRFTFHYYLPYEFSHQGVQPGLSRYLGGLPFPASSKDYEGFMAQLEGRVRGSGLAPDVQTRLLFDAKPKLRDYFDRTGTVAYLEAQFDEVSNWAKRYGVAPGRIFLGEFGAVRSEYKGADAASRAAYMKAVRMSAERRGFTWAVWVLEYSEMGLVTGSGSPDLDPGMLQALGLN